MVTTQSAALDGSLNPFLPGRPAPGDLFIGRVAQLDRLAQCARQSATGRLNVAYLSGERGIGKTSLVSFLRRFLEMEFGVLGVHVFLSGAGTLEQVQQRILDAILKVASRQRLAEANDLLAAGKHLDAVMLAMSARLKPRYRGMMLVLDDINDVASSPEFAHWLKNFVDTAATGGEEPPLFLLLAGYKESRQALIRANQSLDRVLQSEPLGPWSPEEAEEFFSCAFERCGRVATPSALRLMASSCNGRPSTAHQLGDAAFRADRDGQVTDEDAMGAMFDLDNGLFDVVPLLDTILEEPPEPAARPGRRLFGVLRSLLF